ncbi:CRISPR-associated protein Cas4 [bacterium CG2_30_54_10]|nr:MAG: CRISPR-associated protein Cas4 [bacterium CG2_30_54_10]
MADPCLPISFSEDELIPISALQHLLFCERQWALIHLEGEWKENRFTAGGKILHEKVHGAEAETRKELRIARGLSLRSLRWGLIGKADMVEFHRLPEECSGETAKLPGRKGWWRPFPVEFKFGKPKTEHCDEVQLCAQALCLEEMMSTPVPKGALYYGNPHQRCEVSIDQGLRDETARLLIRLRELAAGAAKPSGRFDRKCESCSLVDQCIPKMAKSPRSARKYLESLFEPETEASS